MGRLDFNSEGLIFLTNDGQFALRLTHPRYGVRKKYVATVEGKVNAAMLARVHRAGIWHGGEKLKAEKARLVSAQPHAQSVVELELGEGKNREVRRLFESQNLSVKRLQRMQIGKIKLGELKLGKWRTLTETEIKTLLAGIMKTNCWLILGMMIATSASRRTIPNAVPPMPAPTTSAAG